MNRDDLRYLLKVLAVMAALVGIVWARNSYCMYRMDTSYLQLYKTSDGEPPLFFDFVVNQNGKHIGFWYWPLGPFEYRDRNTGAWLVEGP